ncbi:protein kinase [Frankia sp. CNm7]|uniref:non-specific serine/threonine protein kinase n=1 Tax=Frankia nepalensis TaxID=1836974 RepID=A0A937RG78_9ACTN|nr:serine/threonine protein kinase [Frankia nepalensis]MBL7495752.1 protein kinase [Frankia nepalensis]MBL7509026.1 protein kinase [Frankia nepalensis]MBL7523463.1 protein kinase [Frankia nepalensis]MBL7629825.1 protein kinase [Frankia nepalensis]
MPTIGASDGHGADGYLGGRYRLGSVIGGGGGGTVHEGEDVLLRRPVAIKEVRLPIMGSAAERDLAEQRVLREARAAARLRHPGLVTVYDVLNGEGRSWIVMEFVDGVSLAQLISDSGRLAPERVARIGISLTYALEAAHRAGVVHRDVKPGNVLVTVDGQSRLTDFGIAVSRGDTALTGTGMLVGSPAYIAPERVRGARAVYASDVWGLGATLFTAVEGAPPFEGKGTLATLAAVVENRRRPLTHAGHLSGVLEDMLDADPDRRPSLTQIRGRLHETVDDSASAGGGRRRHFARAALARRPSRPRESDGADQWLEILADSRRPALADDARPATAAGTPAAHEANADGGDTAGGDEQKVAAVGALSADEGAEHSGGGASDDKAPEDNAFDRGASDGRAPDGRASDGNGGPSDADAVPVSREGDRGGSRRRVSMMVAAALASLLAVGTILGLAINGGGAEPAALARSQEPPAASSGPITSSAPTTSPARPGPSGPPPGAAVPPASADTRTNAPPARDYDTSLGALVPTDSTPARPPDGYTTSSGRSGWSVAVPNEWSASSRGADRVLLAPPSGSPELLVEAQSVAGPSAIDAWRSLEGSVRATSPGYRLLSIRPADGRDGAAAAIWEFTFTSGGRTVHVLDLGVVRNGHGYALRWRTSQDEWDSQQDLMWRIFATFRPGP